MGTLRKIWAGIYNNKTKITGLIIALIGSLQMNSFALKAIMTEHQFSIFIIAAGLVVAGLGFVNSYKPAIAASGKEEV